MNSLYSKFAITTLGIMALSFLISFLLSNAYYQHFLKDENDAKNVEVSESIKEYIESDPNIDVSAYLKSVADVGYQIIVVNEDYEMTHYGSNFREENLPIDAVDQVLAGDTFHGIMEFPSETFVTGFFSNESINTIGVPVGDYAIFVRPDVSMLFHELQLLFAWLLGIMVVLSVILVLVGTKILVQPITQLQLATQRLASGDYDTSNVNTERRDEIGQLSRNFVAMTKKIETQQSMQKAFISNISHDIQSPLANIKGYSELLAIENASPEHAAYLNVINQEVLRISTLTDQLLVLTKLDYEEDFMTISEIDVKAQLETLIESFTWRIEEKGLMITYDLEDCIVHGDAALLNMVWDNLLSNAIKYNVDGGSIDVSLEYESDDALITVKDSGIGIPEDQLDTIFDRFYRADESRSPGIKGSGLGLAIVKQIVDLHDGSVEVSSSDSGTEFRVRLKK